MMLRQHAVLVLRDVLIRLGMVLVCIMTINPTSSTGSQCENSISLVLINSCVKVIYFGRK